MSEISVPAHRNNSVELQIHDLSLCFLQLIHIEQLATVPWKNRTKWLPTQEYFLHLNCVFLLDRCRVENSCDTCLLSQMRDKWENSISLQIVGANSTIILSINPWNHPYNHLQMTSRNQQLTSFSWCEQVLAMDAAIPLRLWAWMCFLTLTTFVANLGSLPPQPPFLPNNRSSNSFTKNRIELSLTEIRVCPLVSNELIW